MQKILNSRRITDWNSELVRSHNISLPGYTGLGQQQTRENSSNYWLRHLQEGKNDMRRERRGKKQVFFLCILCVPQRTHTIFGNYLWTCSLSYFCGFGMTLGCLGFCSSWKRNNSCINALPWVRLIPKIADI